MESNPALRNAGDQILLGKRTNVLLVKDDVGKAKPTTRNIPKGDFAFGKPAGGQEMLESAQDGMFPILSVINWSIICIRFTVIIS